jgi:predicted transglutaminase-like cysteine proteinase
MGDKPVKLAIALGLGLWAGGCAGTMRSYVPQALPQATPTATFLMPDTGQPAIVPAGYIDFCIRFATDCQAHPGAADKIVLDPANWMVLQNVNTTVNAAIWPEDDDRHYGRAEYWTIPTDGYGDCEDYALTKRRSLMAQGLPEPALRLAIVVTPRFGRHTVLTIVTDRGDFVLDNLTDDIKPWNNTDYVWLEWQNPKQAFGWTALNTSATLLADNNGNKPTAQSGESLVATANVNGPPPLTPAVKTANLAK